MQAETRNARVVEVQFDDFGWEALSEEATAQGVSVPELVAHAAMYYLADESRGTMARRPLRLKETGRARP